MAITLTEIEAIISLRDELSGKLEDIGGKLDTLSGHADKTGNSVSGLGGMMTLATTAGNLLSRGIEAVGGAAVGAVKDAFSLNSTLETATLSFTTLTGSSEKAKDIVASLFEFAAKTPFRTDEVIAASRTLQVFGGEALNTKENLTLVGDAAAATGAPIQEVSNWVGRMYASMASNKPIGEAIENLRRLGVVGPEAADALTTVAASGKTIEEKFSVAQDILGKFTGAMELQAASWTGVTSTFADTFALMMAQTFHGAFEVARDTLGNINTVLADADLQAAFAGIGEAIVSAFGTDSQSQTLALTKLLLGFFDTTLAGVEAAYRGWYEFKAGVLGAITEITNAAAKAADINAKLAEMAASLPVVGDRYKESAAQARDWAVQLGGMADSLKQQTQEARNAADGQTTFTTAIGNARRELGEAGAKVIAHAEEQKRLADQGIITGVSMADLEKATRGVGNASQIATEEQKKHAAEIAKLGGADSIAAATHMEEAIAKYGLQAVIAAEGIQKVHDTFEKAANIHLARGEAIPKTWSDAQFATLAADKTLNTYTSSLDGLIEKVPKLKDAFPKDAPVLSLRQWDDEITKFIAGLPAVADTMIGPGMQFSMKFKEGFLGDDGLKGLGGDIGDVITQAITGGGDIGQAIGSLVGSKVGSGLNDAFQGMFLTGGALAGIAETGFGEVLGGAANAILPGVGSLLGKGLDAIFGGLFKTASKAANDLRGEYMLSAGGFDALAEKAAAAGTTIKEVMDADSPKELKAAIADLEAQFKAHQETLKAWGADLQDVLSTGAMMTDDLREKTVELMKQDPSGTQDTAWAFLQSEMAKVADGFDAAVDAWAAPFESLVSGAGEAAESVEDLADQQATLSDWAATNADDFYRFGSLAVGVFEQLQQGGMDTVDALAAMKPALTDLNDIASTLGWTGSETFQQMLRFTDLAEDYAPLLKQVEGLDDVMVALHNTGLLTSSMFFDLAGQITDTFGDMVAGGADANDAMQVMQPSLQRLWELQHDFKWEVDDSTQKLLDEAEASGIVGDKFRDAQDRMTAAIEGLIGRLDLLITTLGGDLPSAAWNAVGDINTAFGQIDWNGVQQKSQETFDQIGQNAEDAAFNKSVVDIADVIDNYVLPSMDALSATSTFVFGGIGTEADVAAAAVQHITDAATDAAEATASIAPPAPFVGGGTGTLFTGPGFDAVSDVVMGGLSWSDQLALDAQVKRELSAKEWKDWLGKQATATKDIVGGLDVPAAFKDVYEWLAASQQTYTEMFGRAVPMVETLKLIVDAFGGEAGKARITTKEEQKAQDKAMADAAKAAEAAARAQEKAAMDAARAAAQEAQAAERAREAFAKLYGESLTGVDKELYTLELRRQKELAAWTTVPEGMESVFAEAVRLINVKYDALVADLRNTTGVPAFAEGGIITRPTVGLIGEDGPEAIIPLTGDWPGASQPVEINVYLDGRIIAQAAARHLPRELKVYGVT